MVRVTSRISCTYKYPDIIHGSMGWWHGIISLAVWLASGRPKASPVQTSVPVLLAIAAPHATVAPSRLLLHAVCNPCVCTPGPVCWCAYAYSCAPASLAAHVGTAAATGTASACARVLHLRCCNMKHFYNIHLKWVKYLQIYLQHMCITTATYTTTR